MIVIPQVLRYLIASGVGAVVDLAIFASLVYGADVHYLWAGVVGFLVATLANYLVSVRIVFTAGVRFPRLIELGVIYAVSFSGLLWHQLILLVCVERAGVHLMLSKLLALGAVFFWNYLLRRYFVFARTPRRS